MIPVFLLPVDAYPDAGRAVDCLCARLGLAPLCGRKVLLKPNLVSGRRKEALPDAGFVAAVARWFVDRGARVSVGDSPAFGSGRQVMRQTGMEDALKGLPVRLIDFVKKERLVTESGLPGVVAAEVFEHDLVVNLPKVKAHGQLGMTLALKNFFGVVPGCRKAMAHMRYGDGNALFHTLLLELPRLLPGHVSIIDGIMAMHVTGPVDGDPYPLGLVGASHDPVALDTAIYTVVGASPGQVPLWAECARRGLAGSDPANLAFPLHRPEELAVDGFRLPGTLDPIRFRIFRFLLNSCKKLSKLVG